MATMKIKKAIWLKLSLVKTKDNEGKVIAVNAKTIQFLLRESTWLLSIQNQVWLTSRVVSFIRKHLSMFQTLCSFTMEKLHV